MSELQKHLENRLSNQYLTMDKIPSKIKAKIVNYTFKPDKQGNECLYLTLETPDAKRITQKYTQSTWETLYESMKQIGFENLEKAFCTWKKAKVGKTIFERLYPTLKE